MKFTSLQENLKQGLFIVSHVAGKNVNLPILNNVLIKIENKNIQLITTDLEIGVVHTIRGKVEEEGSFTVNSRMISDYINLLPNKKVELEKQEENLKITCENYHTKIKGQPADDYPLIPQVEKQNKISVKINDLKKALNQVSFAVAGSDSRVELSGVLFSFSGDKMTLAATDSYRLTEKEISVTPESQEELEDKKIIVPSKTIQELLRILSGLKENGELEHDKQEIDFYLSDNQILFTTQSTELVSRLIEGQYPDYKQIIPESSNTSITVNKSELVRAVKTSSLFSKSGVNDVNLDFPEGKDQVVVSSTSGQTGENVAEIEAKTSGKDNSIIVNYQYLLDGLKAIEDEEVKIEVVDNNTPCAVKPVNNDNYIYIIMPIKQ